MQYQLVLQFPATGEADFDQLIELEDAFTEQFDEELAEVDGHDFGSSEMNIFIHTDQPEEVFVAAKETVTKFGLLPKLTAAYRDFAEEEYQLLWPQGSTKPFDIA